MAHQDKTLFIRQLNINSVRNKIHEVQLLLEDSERKGELAILLLNDTRLNNQDTISFRNHYVIRRDHSSNTHYAGGVAAIIPNEITTSEINEFRNLETESLCFELFFANRHMRIATSYVHPGDELVEEFYNLLTNDSNGKFLCFMADTNAHIGALHDIDHGRPSTPIGERLLDNFSERGFILTNEIIPTYFSAANEEYSELLDMCFVKQGSSILGWDWKSDCCCSSDHNLTSLEVWAPELMQENRQLVTCVNWEKVKEKMMTKQWPRITEHTKQGVDNNIRDTVLGLQEIIRTSSRLITKRNSEHLVLSANLLEWISIKRKLNKLRQTTNPDDEVGKTIRKISNRCNRKVKQMKKEEAEWQEEQTSDKIANERDATKRWRKFDAFCKQQQEATKKSGLLDNHGVIRIKDEELAEIHATRLEKTHSDIEDTSFDQGWKDHVEQEIQESINLISPNSAPDQYVIQEEPVTVEEVISHLKKTQNKAPGIDKVTNKVLKMGSVEFLTHLSLLLTVILSLGYFPDEWKIGLVIMLAKAGRDHRLSKNFRPITLLSVLSKLLEAIILSRLKRARALTTPENFHQAGYKSKRSCQEHLLRILETIYCAFNRRLCVLACFLDVDSAFDAIWTKGLYYKILHCRIPPYLKKVLADFLRNRRHSTGQQVQVQRNQNEGRNATRRSTKPGTFQDIHR